MKRLVITLALCAFVGGAAAQVASAHPVVASTKIVHLKRPARHRAHASRAYFSDCNVNAYKPVYQGGTTWTTTVNVYCAYSEQVYINNCLQVGNSSGTQFSDITCYGSGWRTTAGGGAGVGFTITWTGVSHGYYIRTHGIGQERVPYPYDYPRGDDFSNVGVS